MVLSGEKEELHPGDFLLPDADGGDASLGFSAGALLDGQLQLPPGGLDLEAFLRRLVLSQGRSFSCFGAGACAGVSGCCGTGFVPTCSRSCAHCRSPNRSMPKTMAAARA